MEAYLSFKIKIIESSESVSKTIPFTTPTGFLPETPVAIMSHSSLAIFELYNTKPKIKIIGTRHGEKLFESLVNREEMAKVSDLEHYYRIPADNRDLNYGKYFIEGEVKVSKVEEYTSHNTERLDVEGMKQLLLKLPMIRKDVLGEDVPVAGGYTLGQIVPSVQASERPEFLNQNIVVAVFGTKEKSE